MSIGRYFLWPAFYHMLCEYRKSLRIWIHFTECKFLLMPNSRWNKCPIQIVNVKCKCSLQIFPMKHWGEYSWTQRLLQNPVKYLGSRSYIIIYQIWSQSQYNFCPVYWSLCVHGEEKKLLFFYYIFLFQITINKLLSNYFWSQSSHIFNVKGTVRWILCILIHFPRYIKKHRFLFRVR